MPSADEEAIEDFWAVQSEWEDGELMSSPQIGDRHHYGNPMYSEQMGDKQYYFGDNLVSTYKNRTVSLLGGFVLDSTKQPKQITIHSCSIDRQLGNLVDVNLPTTQGSLDGQRGKTIAKWRKSWLSPIPRMLPAPTSQGLPWSAPNR
jgi:hypothetical protein